jgi:catechol 2,3-dioxygenase-like lactoylglutathione lyase family enzyme
MKRFHVHVSVDDLDANIRFYSTVFGLPPAVQKDDYAKWMLDDPRVNFAISKHGARPGLDHLGVQVDSDEELAVLRAQAQRAEIAALDQTGAACCYARSDKYWITDPQGIAWETFHTLDAIPVFGADSRMQPAGAGNACCAPAASVARVDVASPAKPAGKSACCG